MSDPLRVLVISHPSTMWGAQLRLLDTAPHLAARGVELVLAAPEGSRFPEAWVAAGLPYLPLALPAHKGLRRDDGRRLGPLGMAREVAAVLVSTAMVARVARRHDALLSFSLWAHLETALAGRLTRTPVVVEVVDLVTPGLGQKVLGLARRLASLVVVNSAATGATVGDGADIRVIHPGVDLERFTPGPADPVVRASLGGVPDAPLIGIIGRVDPRKGIQDLVEAVALLARTDARLVVVGDVGVGTQDFADDLRRTAAERLGDRVTFAGRRSDIPEVVRALDVLVNASVAEPFGRSVLEAQAAGVPVVAPRSGGIPEFVVHEQTGLLVPQGRPAELAAAIDRLLADADLRARLVAGARCQAEAHFGNDSRYDLIAADYRELVRSGR